MQRDGIGIPALLQRATELLQRIPVTVLTHDHQHLAVRTETEVRQLRPEVVQPACDTRDEPLFHREMQRPGPVDRVADADRLVVRQHPALRLPVHQGSEAQIRVDPEIFRRGLPLIVVAGGPVDVADDAVDVDRFGAARGDATRHKHPVAVHSDLDADECTGLERGRRGDEAVRDRVAQLVGVTREDELGRITDHGHGGILRRKAGLCDWRGRRDRGSGWRHLRRRRRGGPGRGSVGPWASASRPSHP